MMASSSATTKTTDMAKQEPAVYLNHYECDNCGQHWVDEWSCACNDRCPACGIKDIEPYESIVLEDQAA